MSKFLSLPQAVAQRAIYAQTGKTVVFTNGCFDLIHAGHITYLQQAKQEGDILILALNSDASIQRLKGPKRPIVPLEDRLIVLSALEMIDHLVVFEEDTPIETLKALTPDIHIKGGDYTKDRLPETPIIEAYGGTVMIKPFVDNRSSSALIQRICERYC